MLAPQIALSVRFAFQSVHGAQLSRFQLEAKAEDGDKGLVFLVYLGSYSQGCPFQTFFSHLESEYILSLHQPTGSFGFMELPKGPT